MRFREPDGLLRSQVLPLALLVLALQACGGEGSGFQFPITTGTLQVTTSTTGAEVDPDGFTLKIDNETPEPIGTVASLERLEVQPGDHTIFLGELAPNCSVADNPRTVSIVAAQTLTAAFEVTCNATSGGVTVTTVTSGPSPDPDGYSIVLDGVDQGPIPANGQSSFTGLTLGSHVVGLSGLAGNCQLQGDNLRTVAVAAGAATPVDYAIACAAPPPGAGTLRITTVTEGADPDPNGYSLALDGGSAQPIGANAVSTITSLPPGAHSVRLSGVAENCRLQGRNPRPVTVPAGGTADLSFTISCTRASGTIRVTASTTGAPADPDGYVATLDGASPGLPVDVDGSNRFTDVPVGAHTIVLSDIEGNCAVTGSTSRSVTVSDGETSEVNFVVTCSGTSGTVVVNTQTGGPSPDTDGYTIVLDETERGPIPPNGQASVTGLAPGSHVIELRGVATNCTVEANPRTFQVAAGATANVSFNITCTEPPPATGTIQVNVTTSGEQQDDGYVVTLDATPGRPITANDSETYTNVSVGNHEVTLSGVAENCTVDDATRPAPVTANQTTEVNFAVTCTVPPPETGSIAATTNTSGDNQDEAFTVSTDGGGSRAIGPRETIVFNDLSLGEHEIELADVAENCTVEGGNAKRANVPAGGVAPVDFLVSCVAPSGSINLNVSRSGE